MLAVALQGCGSTARAPNAAQVSPTQPAARGSSAAVADIARRNGPPAATSTTRRAETPHHHRGPPDAADATARMLGQMIVARFAGRSPPTQLLARVKAGEVGGVILFADNVLGGRASVLALTETLQRAARAGGNPPLLLMADQEGGEVRRLSWAPPQLPPSAMGSSELARTEGEATGEALREVGINVDLAPVADVEQLRDSFLGSRAFGSVPRIVAARACAFAEGLAMEGVAFTLKHFPGLGRATTSTDAGPTTVEASAASLRNDYQAYRECGAAPGALVMISSAAYPSLTGTATPAALSSDIYRTELPYATGEPAPTTISDDLQAPAISGLLAPARRAIDAGLDLLLYAQTEAGSAEAYQTLLGDVRAGAIPTARLAQADRSIQTLKVEVGGR